MSNVSMLIDEEPLIEGPHGQLFGEWGIMHNREQEALAMRKNPLRVIGKAILTHAKETEPRMVAQLKFEGQLHSQIKILEDLANERFMEISEQLTMTTPTPDDFMATAQYHTEIRNQAMRQAIMEATTSNQLLGELAMEDFKGF